MDSIKAPVVVHHYLKGTTTKVADDVRSNEVIGSEYTAQPVTTYQEKNLTVDSYNPSQKVTVSENGNEITIYYTLPLTIAAKTDSKTYDGNPLDGDYTVTGALESDSDTITAALGTAPSITNVADGPKQYLTETEQAAIAPSLTINPVEIVLTAKSDEKPYDGTPLTNDGYDITTGEFVGEEGLASVTVEGSQTVPGSSDNEITGHTLKDNTKAVNYDISYVKGTLTVTDGDLSVTIVVNDKTKTYDGTEYTGYTISSVTGTGETITTEDYTVTAAEYGEGTFGTITIKNGEVDVTDSYNISKTAGKLSIEKREVTLTSGDAKRSYNGEALTNEDVTGKNANGLTVETGWVEGEGATYSFTGSQTLVGESANAFTVTPTPCTNWAKK